MLNRFRNAVASLISSDKNSFRLGNDFLRRGNRRLMESDWTQVVMDDRDLYTGYLYAAIKLRANKVARIAIENISTWADNKDLEHPYLQTITNSKTFSDYQFWRDISTFIDLKGVYYLMAIRGSLGETVGAVKEFKLLSPYNIKRVLDGNNLEVAGYIETRKGMQREIPKEMIIPIWELNPFSEDVPFSMADAAKESQFTLKTGGDFTRHAMKHNINAPGILSTDVILSPEKFENFTERVKNHTKGEPIFANGKGAVTWDNMNVELSKSSIADVNEINRQALFSIAGVSKTSMGIEESGTTRDTATLQRDLNIEDHILPRIQLIVDALNQDYINHYPQEYAKSKIYIMVNNPLGRDHTADKAETDVKQAQFDLYNALINKGYDFDLAAKYASGEIDLDALGEPTNEPITVPIPATTMPADMPTDTTPANANLEHTHKNQTQEDNVIKQQSAALKNAIVNADEQLVMSVINHVQAKAKNAYNVVGDIITASKKTTAEQEITAILTQFYGIVFKLEGPKRMRQRISQLGMGGSFSIGAGVSNDIATLARKVSKSHVSTVLDDLLVTTREAALRGDSIVQIVSSIKTKYAGTVVEQRANVIARTETNRAFTRAQYEADRQFIDQNDLQGRVYKQWRTRSDNPCAFCQALEAEGEVPFGDAFRDIGESIDAGGKSLDVSFESLEAGNAHPNCSCDYELIIRSENSLVIKQQQYEEMDKRTREAKQLLEEIQKERLQLEKEKAEVATDKKEIDEILNDLEKL